MIKSFSKLLENAQGRSEFVIVVVCDIRGFSSFSTIHESPDIAMFIKRFYLQLITKYFAKAAFVKPTGDGLLMVFKYSEKTLYEVTDYVFKNCFAAINEFPDLFNSDPMINFKTPTKLGFGISRGPACCLYSGRSTIDYSGNLLNLASRLNDLARPMGIVVDGGFLIDVIPEALRPEFYSKQVFVRSIAEDSAIDVFCSNHVELPSHALYPIAIDSWELLEKNMTLKDLYKWKGVKYNIDLPADLQAPDKFKVDLVYPNTKIKDGIFWNKCQNVEFYKDARGAHIRIDVDEALGLLEKKKLRQTANVSLRVHYVPKNSSSSKKA